MKDYPEKLRRIHNFGREKNRGIVFLPKKCRLPALKTTRTSSISMADRVIFQIWIKQHLRVKAIYSSTGIC